MAVGIEGEMWDNNKCLRDLVQDLHEDSPVHQPQVKLISEEKQQSFTKCFHTPRDPLDRCFCTANSTLQFC